MSIKLEKQTIHLGAGLTRVVWGVWDDNLLVGWESDWDAAHRRAHIVKEQKEHRDGA